MNFRKFKIKNSGGFTLIEILLVIAISAVAAFASFTYLGGYRTEQNLKLTASEVLSAVKNAQQLSKSQQDGKKWGVRFFNTTSSGYYSVFSGISFDSGTVSKTYYLGRNINFGNPGSSSTIDVLFNASTGNPSQSQVISLNSGRGEGFIGDIAVSTLGIISSRFDTGLIGYWHFDENTSSTAYDASGVGNNGTLTNNPTWQSGSNCKSGSCLSFDGTNDYVNIPSNSSINPPSAVTVAAWVKSATANYNTGVWGIVSNYSAYILGPSGTNSTTMCFITYTSGWNYGNCSAVSNPQSWHHFAGTYDTGAGTQKFYVDGILASSTTATGNIANGGAIHIAHREIDVVGTNHFNGSLDEVRIYNRALSATEIADIYNTAR